MQISENQGRRSVQVSQASVAWHSAYTKGLDLPPPSLVLDFENGVYRTEAGAPHNSFGAAVNFSRASGKVVTDETGTPQSLTADTPGFDWATGRRGLHISAGLGGDAADLVSVTAGNWWSNGPGCFVLEASILANNGGYDRLLDLNDGSNDNRVSVFYNAADARLACVTRANAATQAALIGGSTAVSLPELVKTAATFDTDDVRFLVNGGFVLSDTSAVLPSAVSTLNIGASFSGHRSEIVVHSLIYFSLGLTNSELIALTQ